MTRRARDIAILLITLALATGLLASAGAARVRAGVVRPASNESTSATLNGSGSSWAAPAIDQWSEDVRPENIVINYNADGSQQGRSDFTSDLSDFAGSDIAFLNGQDKIAGGAIETSKYGYSYLPITAGGTAFMYHLTVAGKRITNLRLSGTTITDIFTGVITNWDDPRITKDYGAQLPSEPITPVIRSDGSGATAQFTAWMNNQFGPLWDTFCARYAHVTQVPCGETEFYPSFGSAKAQGSSTAVANYVSESFGEGSIGYDEYAYALDAHIPVVKVENPAGYYVLPTASNDAVALTHAVINFDQSSVNYLTEDLTGVYANKDPRSYPISSYSYLIVPRTVAGKPIPDTWSAAKGATMSNFANYFLCAGQKEAAGLGYSPLPANLVTGGFNQVAAMPSAIATPASKNLAACGNPTFVNGKNVLLATAPFPSACDKVGSSLYGCGTTTTTSQGQTNQSNTAATDKTVTTNTTAGSSNSATTPTSVDPVTGQVVSNGSTGSNDTASGEPAQTVLVSADSGNHWLPALIAAAAIIAAVAAPPTLTLFLRRRRSP